MVSTVAIEPVGRGVGKMLLALRAIFLLVAFFPVMGGCATDSKVTNNRNVGSSQSQEDLLIPWHTIKGGQLATQQDQNGFPLPGSFSGFSTLIFPVALAARAPDLYIADAGAQKIYRFNSDLQSLSVVSGVDATNLTRLQVAPDYSLLVLDPARSLISSFARGGQRLQTLSSPVTSAHLTEFIVQESYGRIYAVDQLNQQIVPLHPLGLADMPLITAGTSEIRTLGALASAGRTLYTVDAGCACVVAIDETGRARERIGKGVLVQPRALVADRYGHLFVADGFDHTLKVFLRGALVASYTPSKLHVIDITALAIDQSVLYVADGPGAQVLAFRIRLP